MLIVARPGARYDGGDAEADAVERPQVEAFEGRPSDDVTLGIDGDGEHQTVPDRQLRDRTLREVDQQHSLGCRRPMPGLPATAIASFSRLSPSMPCMSISVPSGLPVAGVERTDVPGGDPQRAVRERDTACPDRCPRACRQESGTERHRSGVGRRDPRERPRIRTRRCTRLLVRWNRRRSTRPASDCLVRRAGRHRRVYTPLVARSTTMSSPSLVPTANVEPSGLIAATVTGAVAPRGRSLSLAPDTASNVA